MDYNFISAFYFIILTFSILQERTQSIVMRRLTMITEQIIIHNNGSTVNNIFVVYNIADLFPN